MYLGTLISASVPTCENKTVYIAGPVEGSNVDCLESIWNLSNVDCLESRERKSRHSTKPWGGCVGNLDTLQSGGWWRQADVSGNAHFGMRTMPTCENETVRKRDSLDSGACRGVKCRLSGIASNVDCLESLQR